MVMPVYSGECHSPWVSMTRTVASLLCIVLCESVVVTPSLPAQQSASPQRPVIGRVVSVAADRSSITIAPRDGGQATVWPVSENPQARERAKAFRVGDVIAATAVGQNGQLQITAADPVTVTVSPAKRALFVAASAIVIWIVAQLLAPGGARWLVLGEDNRYSNSKTQFALWSWLLFTVYLATIGIRLAEGGMEFLSGVNVPVNLLWLSGISAMTFAGAKQLVASRIDSAKTVMEIKRPPVAGPSFPRDLVTDDSGRRPDLGDFQMLVVTLIAVIVYGARVFGWLGSLSLQATVDLPDVDTTLLSAFGIGQAAYLAKKFAGDAGRTAAPGAVDETPPPRPPLARPANNL